MDEFVRKPYRFNEIYECLARQLGVKYRYAEVTVAAEYASDRILTDKMLASLPQALRVELRCALESLEMERINALIAQVADAGLRGQLMRLAGDFDYPAILQALQAG
jgi:hypothetical protein